VVNGEVVERDVRLLEVEEFWEPDYFTGSRDQRTLRLARIKVDVSGTTGTLLCRPYQMPVEMNGLRMYVESTRKWAREAEIEILSDMHSDVRLSVVCNGELWGPAEFTFPINDFRWRSSSYNNTWHALVPYNKLYYHRGEDYGAIPGYLPVVAALAGRVVTTPLPNGDGESNCVTIKAPSGIHVEYFHMDIETMEENLLAGSELPAGVILGRTGMTWSGRKSQTHDPHIHFSLSCGETNISTYPFVMEAYFRSYPDDALAVAGGYHFALPGQSVFLDGSRSLARPGEQIASCQWRLHDGTCVQQPETELVFEAPGLYSEELIVRTQKGNEARDYAQVRVYDPTRGRDMVRGWAYHRPVRGITPGQPVTFWNRLVGTRSDVQLDFGDGSPPEVIKNEIVHAYDQPGVYTASYHATGPDGEPATIKMCVVVEPEP
jgi:murein DD-endopeptidase MepM/ murein hydrolase activator NlpD